MADEILLTYLLGWLHVILDTFGERHWCREVVSRIGIILGAEDGNHKDAFTVLRYTKILCVEHFPIIGVAELFQCVNPSLKFGHKFLLDKCLDILHKKILRSLCLDYLFTLP